MIATIACAMCGKEKEFKLPLTVHEIRGLALSQDYYGVLKRVVENGRWIVQLNGDNVDLYCSRKCAA